MGIVFLASQVIQNPINGLLVLDTGYDPDRSTAKATNLYVNKVN